MLAYVFVPVVKRALDEFKQTVWNNNRGMKQANKDLPTGVPEHIFRFPENYGGSDGGIKISDEQIEVMREEYRAEFNFVKDYTSGASRALFETHIASTDEIKACEAIDAYRYLRSVLNE